ncbi:MAG: peptide chain release factor N(5)-glutamine methyltransferase [Puniceicoccales bacterium]|jgi:release factor glutamine methyltransferase|nr:peptide chain release factor N(5)-glutamine methyltransferase [Puniceicoccales bacterium]
MASVIELLAKGVRFLRSKNIERPKCDGEWLFAHILGCSRLELYLRHGAAVDASSEARLRELLVRRARREPLQYILGEVDFCNVKLKVDPRVLIPRGETEMLVEWLVTYIRSRNFGSPATGEAGDCRCEVLDLGTGNGAIAIALAKYFPASRVFAVDKSPPALTVAQENVERNGVRNVKLLKSDWYSVFESGACQEKFDIIVANPPYLAPQEFASAQDEVRKYEPISALVAGDGGLRDIEIILRGAKNFLKKGGLVALETGITHPQQLQNKYKNFFNKTEIVKDLNQFDRFFMAYV